LIRSTTSTNRKVRVDLAVLGWWAVVEALQVEFFLLHAVHQLVVMTLISGDLVALQVKLAEQSKELADRVHGVAWSPGVNYFGSVAVAEGQYGLVTGPGEIAEGSRPARNVFGQVIRRELARDRARS
jgi:hypothetical protein